MNYATPDSAGEYTGDPSPCEIGEHPDIEGGVCLLCGEWVIGEMGYD